MQHPLEPTDAFDNHSDLWTLNAAQRIRFLSTLLNRKFVDISGDLHPMLKRLDELFEREAELQSQHEANILASKKLIGMTITGASIHHKLVCAVLTI